MLRFDENILFYDSHLFLYFSLWYELYLSCWLSFATVAEVVQQPLEIDKRVDTFM